MIIRTSARSVSCLLCQWRTFSTSYRRLADKAPAPLPNPSSALAPSPGQPPNATPKVPEGPLAHAPRAYGKKLEEFTPTPLSRPIGMNYPPQAGENTGVDSRSLQQRRDDFVNYDKHLVRREQLKSKMSRPYFRDWRNMKFQRGKTFLAPPRLFKADLSLYFPNFHGKTLAKGSEGKAADTTPLLQGRASVVTVFSSMWAQKQAESFTSQESNPALHEILNANRGRAQLVQVNVEEDALKALMITLFSGSLRRKVGEENWSKYFIVRKGITDEIRESIGLLNSKVGYTYLVDHNCRIRWAGSGDANAGEIYGLHRGVVRILDEMQEQNVGEHYVLKR
ncbi:hypothetical protein OQA88_6765 [Cercophora sp. LCS_1]